MTDSVDQLTLLTVEIRVNHIVTDGERVAADLTIRHDGKNDINHTFIGLLDDA